MIEEVSHSSLILVVERVKINHFKRLVLCKESSSTGTTTLTHDAEDRLFTGALCKQANMERNSQWPLIRLQGYQFQDFVEIK